MNATGALFSKSDIRDYRLASAAVQEEFPEEFELSMPKIKNQGSVGSCVAHSISTVIEYHNKIQNDDSSEMSVGYIYGNRTGTTWFGSGMYTRDAVATTCKYGDVLKNKFPYNEEVPEIIDKFNAIELELFDEGTPNRFSTYYKLKTANEIKSALIKHGPVVFAINWYEDIKVVNGIMQTNKVGDAGGHCMVIYGWNKDGWLIQNSWGSRWGKNGRAVMPYTFKIKEAYGITDTIIDDTKEIKKPFSSTIGSIFAKIVNWILNLFKKY